MYSFYLYVDGHHKLIRWRFVTHAGIDGYSRLITFIKCSTNNKAETMYTAFMKGVQRFGLPSRVRTDQGRENIEVARYMLRHRGCNRSSVLVGSSVHNQRIERLWRDLHRCITGIYYRLFYHLEHCGLLNPLSERDLFALHYVYLPRINESITTFADSWNHHGLRTAHNSSPLQLYTTGYLQLRHMDVPALDFLQDVSDGYGVSEEGMPQGNHDDSEVVVPETSFILSQQQKEQLIATINPMDSSTNYGIELYERTLTLLSSF